MRYSDSLLGVFIAETKWFTADNNLRNRSLQCGECL